jgi:hypothetical protein
MLCVDQNSSSSSQEEKLGIAFNLFPITSLLFGSHLQSRYQKVPALAVKLQDNLQKTTYLRDSQDNASDRVLPVSQPLFVSALKRSVDALEAAADESAGFFVGVDVEFALLHGVDNFFRRHLW